MAIAVGFGSETFEFKSKYPHLHMPAYPVEDSGLTAVGSATQLLDGEFMLIDPASREAKRPAGGDLAVTHTQELLYQMHGNPNRGDLQFGQVPVVIDSGYEFISRLHSANITGGGGAAVAYNDRMKVVLASVDINGVTYAGRTVLEPTTTANDYYVAICTVPPDANGWARFLLTHGQV